MFSLLAPGGVFCNLEHVASSTDRLHRRFYDALGCEPGWEDAWKWLEMALLVGVKPPVG